MKIKTDFHTFIPYKLAVELCKKEGCNMEQIIWCLGEDTDDNEYYGGISICGTAYLDRVYNGSSYKDEDIDYKKYPELK